MSLPFNSREIHPAAGPARTSSTSSPHIHPRGDFHGQSIAFCMAGEQTRHGSWNHECMHCRRRFTNDCGRRCTWAFHREQGNVKPMKVRTLLPYLHKPLIFSAGNTSPRHSIRGATNAQQKDETMAQSPTVSSASKPNWEVNRPCRVLPCLVRL